MFPSHKRSLSSASSPAVVEIVATQNPALGQAQDGASPSSPPLVVAMEHQTEDQYSDSHQDIHDSSMEVLQRQEGEEGGLSVLREELLFRSTYTTSPEDDYYEAVEQVLWGGSNVPEIDAIIMMGPERTSYEDDLPLDY